MSGQVYKQWDIAAIDEDADNPNFSRQKVLCPVDGCSTIIMRHSLPGHFGSRHKDVTFLVGARDTRDKQKATNKTRSLDTFVTKRPRLDIATGTVVVTSTTSGTTTSGTVQNTTSPAGTGAIQPVAPSLPLMPPPVGAAATIPSIVIDKTTLDNSLTSTLTKLMAENSAFTTVLARNVASELTKQQSTIPEPGAERDAKLTSAEDIAKKYNISISDGQLVCEACVRSSRSQQQPTSCWALHHQPAYQGVAQVSNHARGVRGSQGCFGYCCP